MKRTTGISALLLILGGCAVGPSYKPASVAPETAKVGMPRASDSARTFYDSLATARRADPAAVRSPSVQVQQAPSTADVRWLEIINDPALTAMVRTAVAQNKDLSLAQARIAEFRANYNAVNGALFPRVSLNGSASKNQSIFTSPPALKYDALRMTADLAWEIDFWGKARRGLEAVTADLASQESAQKAIVLSLVGDVAAGYLQLLELDEERAIATRTLTTRRSTLTLAQQRFAQGIVSELDVRQFEAQLAVPAARLAQTERLQAQQEHALNVLLGQAPTAVQRGGSLEAAVKALTVPDSLPASLLSRRPDVTSADRAYAAATARVGVTAAAQLPSISIIGSFGTQSPSGANLFRSNSELYQAQVGFSFPLYTGGRLENETAAARARADQAKASYEKTALSALREAGDALVGARTARDEATANETQAVALRRALELATLRYQQGITSYLELLDAQRSLFDAELALAQARLRLLTSSVQLYKALGGSWEK